MLRHIIFIIAVMVLSSAGSLPAKAGDSWEELQFTYYEPGENPEADALVPKDLRSLFPRPDVKNLYYEFHYHLIDLDGDGVNEMIANLVAPAFCPNRECPCGIMRHQNGEIIDLAPPEFYCAQGVYTQQEKKNGYPVLKTESGFIERHGGQRENVFYWDGEKYVSDIPPELVKRFSDY